MGLFNNWVYLDEHELNLDWIIRTVRQAVDNIKTLNLSYDELKAYVEDYFKNLDIDTKIQETIQELIDSGRMAEIILEVFNDLQRQINDIRTDITEITDNIAPPSISAYSVNYGKVNIGDIRPCHACFNPARGCVTYVEYSNTDDTTIRMGDLASDNITPLNSFSINVHHMNSITYYEPENVLLIADDTQKVHVFNAVTYSKIKEIDVSITDDIISVTSVNNAIWCVATPNYSNTLKIINIDYEGLILNQFTINIPRIYENASVPTAYIQSAFDYYGNLCLIITPLNDNRTIFGGKLLVLDLHTHQIISGKEFTFKGELEDGFMMDGEIYLYGLSAGSTTQGCLIRLSMAPRNSESIDLYVDETASLNGIGTNAFPFNNLSTAFMNIALFPELNAYIVLKSDISKPLRIYSTGNLGQLIQINGENQYGFQLDQDYTFSTFNILFINVVFTNTATNKSLYFERNSKITMRHCTINKMYVNNFVFFAVRRSDILLEDCIINLNVTDNTFGIIQLRYCGSVTLTANAINTNSDTNKLINALHGIVFNTTAIGNLSNPFSISSPALLLSK